MYLCPVLFTSGVFGRDCVIYCNGHKIGFRFLVLLFPPVVSSCRFPGQVRRRVGDLALFRGVCLTGAQFLSQSLFVGMLFCHKLTALVSLLLVKCS